MSDLVALRCQEWLLCRINSLDLAHVFTLAHGGGNGHLGLNPASAIVAELRLDPTTTTTTTTTTATTGHNLNSICSLFPKREVSDQTEVVGK